MISYFMASSKHLHYKPAVYWLESDNILWLWKVIIWKFHD